MLITFNKIYLNSPTDRKRILTDLWFSTQAVHWNQCRSFSDGMHLGSIPGDSDFIGRE